LKTVQIETCNQCSHYDDMARRCVKTGRLVEAADVDAVPIPTDCPLPNESVAFPQEGEEDDLLLNTPWHVVETAGVNPTMFILDRGDNTILCLGVAAPFSRFIARRVVARVNGMAGVPLSWLEAGNKLHDVVVYGRKQDGRLCDLEQKNAELEKEIVALRAEVATPVLVSVERLATALSLEKDLTAALISKLRDIANRSPEQNESDPGWATRVASAILSWDRETAMSDSDRIKALEAENTALRAKLEKAESTIRRMVLQYESATGYADISALDTLDEIKEES
jgi:hypothetical protein